MSSVRDSGLARLTCRCRPHERLGHVDAHGPGRAATRRGRAPESSRRTRSRCRATPVALSAADAVASPGRRTLARPSRHQVAKLRRSGRRERRSRPRWPPRSRARPSRSRLADSIGQILRSDDGPRRYIPVTMRVVLSLFEILIIAVPFAWLRDRHIGRAKGSSFCIWFLIGDGAAALRPDRGDPLPAGERRAGAAVPALRQGPQALRPGLPPLRHRTSTCRTPRRSARGRGSGATAARSGRSRSRSRAP